MLTNPPKTADKFPITTGEQRPKSKLNEAKWRPSASCGNVNHTLKKSRGKETYIKVSKYTTLLVRKRFTAFLVSQVFMKGFNSDELVGIQILLLKYIN